MTIELKPEQEHILREAVRQGQFPSIEEALDTALQSIATHENVSETGKLTKNQSLSEFLMKSPLAGSELNLERDKDTGPSIELSI
jgi:Arc/MetJ-type ribon-helix-helix transcriptional regulator